MKTLRIIRSIVAIQAILMIVGIIATIITFIFQPNGEYIYIGEPHLEITSSELQTSIGKILPKSECDLVIKSKALDIYTPISNRLKTFIISLVILIAIYMGLIIEIIRRLLQDIENQTPFSIHNIKRVKRIGVLVSLAPIFEWLLHKIFSFWLSGHSIISGTKLVFNSYLGWPVFLLGLLILALGAAFEQGKKIQEENELTI